MTSHALANGLLRVEFFCRDDHIIHTIGRGIGDNALPPLQSRQSGPSTPAFQELREQETQADGKIVFLSGAGDGAHWSMSVHCDGEAITFDVAARITSAPIERRIEYVAAGDDQRAIVLKAVDPATHVTRDAKKTTITQQSASDDALPTTLRWKYAARLA